MKTKSQADKEVGSKRNGRQAISRMRGSNMVILLHVLIFVSLLLTTGAQGAFAQEDYTPTPTEAATETATEALTETPAETATPEATATEEVTATPEVSETPTATQSTSVTEIETPMAPTYTPTVDATATIDQQTLLTQRVREAVSGFLGYVPITELIVSNVEYFDNWAFGTVAVTANPGVEASPFGYLFIAQSNSHEWRVAIEHTTLFSEWILEVPDELVSQEQKDILTAVSALGDGAALLSLPWATGQTWILTGGPHSNDGTGRPWSSLDFAVGGSGEVRAARDGIVYLDCANFVRINHSDGWQTGYYHLTGIVVSNGQTVTRGQLLGYTSSATGCGGSATGAHVHFSLRRSGVKQEINGRDIGGWTVEEGSSEYRGCMVRISDGSRQCSTYQGGSGSIYNNGTIGSGSGSGGGGPSGYTHCANEGGRCNFSGTADVAYGANGAFNYKYGVQNGIDCNNSVFGDPINGVVKACYYKITSTGTSCSSLSGEVRLYDNTNCGGVYTTGINSFGLWTLVPNFNDRAESIVVPSGWSARLYLHDYETSPSACFASTDTDLWNNTFSDGTTVANQATYVRVYNNTSCAGAPSAPSLSSPGNGQTFLEGDNISLSWSATGNEYYGEIWGGPGGTLTFGWQTGTSKVIGAQWAGYTYYWHVKARNSGGESGWSSTWSFTVIPNAPINLTATAASCGAVNLSWMGQSGSVEGYKVYRGGTLIQTLGSGVTSFQNTGLSGSTSYSYVVKAYRGSIESNASNTASVTTPACGPAKPTLVSPANGTTVGRYDSVTLQWNTASGATQYYAEFWGGPSIAMNSGWISGTSFFVGSNFWGGSYQWRVRSRNSSGVISEWSDTWTLTRKIGSPTNLTRNGNTLSWSASPDAPGNIDGYKIYLDGNQVGTAAYNATNYSFANPSCGVNHVFTVKAYKGTLLSDPSNSVSVFIDCPTVPSNDDIGGAKLISTTPYSDQLDVSLATVAGDDPDLPGCYRTKGYHSVWYKFTPPGSGTVNINTLGSDYDTVLSIWTGARGGLSMVACNDDSAGTFQSQLTAGLTGGVQYYILVGEYSGYMAASAVEAQGKLDPGVEALATQNLKIAVAYTVPVPAVPVLQAPAAGAKLTDYTPTLDWNDQAVPPAQYQVQLASASSFSASAILYDTSVTSSEFTFATPLQPGKLFYWRVRAFNGLGQASAWSAARYFYTGWLPPTLSAPANLEAMPNLRPAFDWTDVAGAASYTIQVSRYANLSSPLISVTVTGSAYVST
ncbi:MAG: peptidoglycan DD-metalloendopeptidase family protein, partial [Chloroflexi bacterium]|nr:peptidoglycan DD-metalloendopeptidase family protein [Chloroflexota bacterium]